MRKLNLDDENEVATFISEFGTTKGLRLAKMLGICGKGAKSKANSLSNYAWNKHTAIQLRKAGKIENAQTYETICNIIYSKMDADIKTW